jgi:uncharacterized protein (TIGR03437 family)
MSKKNQKSITAIAIVVGIPLILWASGSGPIPHSTGAPGENPEACAQATCHVGTPVNSAGGNVSLTFSTGNTYTPGASVSITVRVTDPANNRFGFQLTARPASNIDTGQAGSFASVSNTSGMLILCENDVIRGASGCPLRFPIEFLEHSQPSTTGVWTLTWNAPATNVGNIVFYVAGNAVNGNGVEDRGDHVYTANATLSPSTGGGPKPSIRGTDGVISAGAYGAFKTFAEGSWLEIFGTDFAGSEREWNCNDFTNNCTIAPTSLDSVQVMINNKPAFVRFIRGGSGSIPSQVNVQAPADTATGPIEIRVIRNGVSSDPYIFNKAAVAPGLLAPPDSFFIDGKQWVVALFPTSTSSGPFVGRTNLIPGVSFRPARPGETIILYGIGFGPTTPSSPPGQVATQQNTMTNSLSVNFGQTPAQVDYKGLGPGFVGLYQFNVVVPNVADGDHQLNVSVGGAPINQTLFITVQR